MCNRSQKFESSLSKWRCLGRRHSIREPIWMSRLLKNCFRFPQVIGTEEVFQKFQGRSLHLCGWNRTSLDLKLIVSTSALSAGGVDVSKRERVQPSPLKTARHPMYHQAVTCIRALPRKPPSKFCMLV